MQTAEVRSPSIDFPEIAHLADQGVQFAGARAGESRSCLSNWQNDCTDNKLILLNWCKSEYLGSLAVVAKRGHSFVIDLDDPAECECRGFKREWLDGYYAVDTPSGGEHDHGLHDELTEDLGNLVNVYRVKGDKESGKILELKLHNQSVAAPTAVRDALYREDGGLKKCAGIYAPRTPGAKLKRGIHPDFVSWLKQWGEEPKQVKKPNSTGKITFHPDFEMDEFLELHDCTEHQRNIVDGALHVEVESCPHCGKETPKSTIRAAIAKFIFGGHSYGFICHACGISTRDEHEEKMAEEYEGWEPWDRFIYADEDDEILLSGVEDVATTEEAEQQAKAERVVAFINDEPVREEPQQAQAGQRCTPESDSAAQQTHMEFFSYEAQDTGNGERLVAKFGNLIRWISETNEWMVWGAKGWRKDTGGTLMRMTKAVLKDLIDEAYAGEKTDNDKLRHALTSGKMERRKAMVASAGYELGVFTNIADWDAEGWLFNCDNGVIDLGTQTFRERRQSDLCLKQSPVAYDPNAKCPLFESAMRKYFCGDTELVEWFQSAMGVTLTSDTSLQSLFFNQGSGENGKDTVFSVFGYIMGSYWQNVNFMTFAETKNHSEHRNDLAALAGAVRMVTSCETSDGHSLDEGVIKQVTGCSPVTCRQIHGRPFTYVPQYKMWFMSNFEPVIKGNDWGIWRRVKKIPWNYTIQSIEKDPNFPEKLKAEAAAILNWMLAGLKRYIELGYKLPPCKAVEDATAQYRKDMDIIGRFAGESLVISATAKTLGKDIYRAYGLWCKENGVLALSSRRFHAEFKKHYVGQVSWRDVNSGLLYEGVELRFDARFPAENAE